MEQTGTAASMNREVLRLSVPNIVSNISIPLLGIVDTALMGRLESEIYIGAVALGGILLNIIYWGFGFLRMGTTGLTAQAFGRREKSECAAILGRALFAAVSGSLILLLGQHLIAWIGFSLIQGGPEVKLVARQYFLIRIYAAPATIGLFAFHGWFLGLQNARYPMFLTIFVNGMNILFNMFFVLHLGLKADGVAWGTVCAQYLGLIAALSLFFFKYREYMPLLSRKLIFKMKELKQFFSINRDIFIRTICLVFSFAFFTSASAGIGSLTLAANQILLQYISLMSYAVDGFAHAAESLVGRFIGENSQKRMNQAIKFLLFWGCGFGMTFSIGYAFFGKTLLRLFTDQIDVIGMASSYLWWMILLPVTGAVAYMWDGIYIGATATRAMRNMMLLSTLGVFLPVFYIFTPVLGNHGLWLALFLFLLTRGITLWLLAPKTIGRI